MMTIRVYAPVIEPFNTLNSWAMSKIKRKELVDLLKRKIKENGVLNVSYFRPHQPRFFKDFIEPCLTKDGYIKPGEYKTYSWLLRRPIRYKVELINDSPEERERRIKEPSIRFDGLHTCREWLEFYLKYF